MIRMNLLGFGIACLVCVIGLLGCQQRPAVPTVALEPTEPVVVIVVTATSQPTLAPTDTPEPSITPIPTLTEAASTTVTATVRAAATRAPTRVPATATTKPTTAAQPTAAQPTANAPAPTAAPSRFAAPRAVAPEGVAFRDGDTIKFQFTSVGQLAGDQCYRIDATLSHPTGPGAVGDYWVGLCGDQSGAGSVLTFQVRPGRFRDAPNYGTLLSTTDSIPPTPQFNLTWTVTVVRVVDSSDPIHPKVEALSPASASLQDSFFR
ncbi:MAG TPA: hypothetical protein VFD70_27990 [Anaerolineae bacterium]|nr:hypothetical protein [Anaerolineae bacterium]